MRKNIFTWLTAVGSIAWLAPSASLGARPTATAPAAMTFADRTLAGDGIQDRVTSDGLGAYTNGVDSVSCLVFVGGTGDAHCDLSGSRNPVRVFNLDPVLRISGTGPTTPFSSNGTVNIEALAQMHVGEAKLTTAVFATALGQFQLVQRINAATSSVSAVRLDAQTWTVTTSDPFSLGAGDIAQLIQAAKGNNTTIVGLYHMPFEVMVTCPTCVAP